LVGVAVVLFVVINIWFVWPHFGDLQQVQNRRAAALDEIETYNEEISKKAEREAEVARLESATGEVAGRNQAIQLMSAVQRKASSHGVAITRQSRPMTRTNEFFIEQSQNVTTLSGESELIEFLYDLGSGNSTIRVRDLTIRPDPQRYKLSSTIKLVSSYRLKTPAGKKKSRPATTAKK
jgi:hypothetical protein